MTKDAKAVYPLTTLAISFTVLNRSEAKVRSHTTSDTKPSTKADPKIHHHDHR